MNTHAQRIANSRLAGRSPFRRFTAWVNIKREARRARRIEEETIEFLRAMTPELRDDIGVDIGKFNEPQMFAKQNPHVLAASAFIQPRSQPSGRRKRSRSKSS